MALPAGPATHSYRHIDRKVSSMTLQTRAALIAEFLAAREAHDYDTITGVYLAAIEHDAAHPDEPRLMNDLRAITVDPELAVA